MATEKQIKERIEKRENELKDMRKNLRNMKARDKRSAMRAQNEVLGKLLSQRFVIRNILTQEERENLIDEIVRSWNACHRPQNNS